MTFIATVLLYPSALAALCLGAGLAADEAAGRFLPPALLVSVGAATLIGVSQLSTLVGALAPATPYVLLVVAVAGAVLARARVAALAGRVLARPLLAAGPVLVYAIALAPVLLAGRASFSSFMALSDSAVHLIGADYLIQHGHSFAHLDLHNSYGQFVNGYYNTSYPSGADTLFGGSAKLLGLSLMWAFQPFNAFMLATAFGPAWVIARRMALPAPLAWAAALSAVLGALVYGLQLLGSIKEITALSMMLTAGALVALHPTWLGAGARRAVPIALVLAAGVSALGVAFGVWALVALLVLGVALAWQLRAGRIAPPRAVGVAALAAAVAVVAALPTLTHLSGSVQVASNIASTANPGNLRTPLRAIQVLGVWLSDSYKLQPRGTSLDVTHALAVLAGLSAVLGVVQLLRVRAFALAAWVALTLLAWLIVSESVTTWGKAKTLMLTSPVVVLLAWGGVAALASAGRARRAGRTAGAARRATRGARGEGSRRARRRAVVPARVGAVALAAALLGGVLVSDAKQYRASNLAPTARYEQLASLDAAFKGQGPALFTDFDEYALYELRDLDVGGPNFVFAPPALAGLAGGYGNPVELDRAAPAALLRYPLIITRRNPLLPRPPAAYELVRENAYYQVWKRRAGAPAAIDHRRLLGGAAAQCRQIAHAAAAFAAYPAPAGGYLLAAAPAPTVVPVALESSSHPARWGHQRAGLVMSAPGVLRASFRVPAAGRWRVWVQGQIMPTIQIAVDGRPLEAIGGQLSGNSLVPNTVPPRALDLSAGVHTVTVRRSAPGLAPGGRGSAVLDAIFLTPQSEPVARPLALAPASRWRDLCGRSYQWLEVLRGPA